MLKIFFKISVLMPLLTITISLADDFLAKVTNGALSDNSAGVKRLSQEEASQVVGGYYVVGGNGDYITFENINAGSARYAEIGVVVEFTPYEILNRTSCGLGRIDECNGNVRFIHAENAYREVASVANPFGGQYLAITASKTTTRGLFGIPQYKFGTKAIVIGVYGGKVYKLYNANINGKIAREVKQAYENNLNRILINRF